MRLQKYEREAIKDAFSTVFTSGKIYLFGSRTDDSLKGGDIDLYIETKDNKNILDKKIEFLVELKKQIGDQKIDVVISRDKRRIIEQEAVRKGILL